MRSLAIVRAFNDRLREIASGPDPDRAVVGVVLDRDLRLAVGAQVGQRAVGIQTVGELAVVQSIRVEALLGRDITGGIPSRRGRNRPHGIPQLVRGSPDIGRATPIDGEAATRARGKMPGIGFPPKPVHCLQFWTEYPLEGLL